MTPKDKSRICFLSELIEQQSKEIKMLTENGDQVKEYFAIDLSTNEVFLKDIDFKKIEHEAQKSGREHIAIASLKSVLKK
jgi:hypothetical protein